MGQYFSFFYLFLSGMIMHAFLYKQQTGDDLKAYMDNEEKMYQSALSAKSDQSNQLGEKSSAMQASGFMLR